MYKLVEVSDFAHQVTGVTVSENGRIFVNFPRWTEDAPMSVGELMRDGSVEAYPNAEWNAWRNKHKDEMTAHDHFVCVQSVVADGRGSLWVLDPAAPAQSHVVEGGPKLARIELSTSRVTKVYPFGEDVAPQGSYLNDVRFSNDGKHAFITDSGVKGALVVLDLESGQARRVLDGHPSTQMKKGLQVKADGQVLRRPDGRGVEFSADGIALSDDGQYLYWQAIKGDELYRIRTEVLCNEGMQGRDVSAHVEPYGVNGVADGLLVAKGTNRMYITAVQENAIKMRDLDEGPQGSTVIIAQDERLRWPDTFSQGPDGTIYVTASRIQDSAFFKPDAPAKLRTHLFRLEKEG